MGMQGLVTAVGSMLGCTSPELNGWDEETIHYRAYLPARTLARLSGTARCDGAWRDWSLVRKTGAPAREVCAYGAEWLGAAGFRPARCYLADGNVLWLEHVRDRYDGRWPLEAFEAAAAALGSFNGRFLVSPPPDEHWLSRDWIEKHQDLPALSVRPSEQRVQVTLRGTLDSLPQTVCHHDAAQANLFLTDEGVVAIDWEGTGWGAVGADLATLVVGTMRRGDFDPERASELDEVAFRGYASGLAEAGWREESVARRGYCAAIGLRWPIVAAAPGSALARFVIERTEEAGA
jgi:hypothetical protein